MFLFPYQDSEDENESQGGEEGESLNEDEENDECSESFWNFQEE